MRKLFLFAIVLVVLMFPSVAVNYPYTATQIANSTYDEITHVLRTLMIAIGPYQLNSRNYTLDQIFNLVYDSTNHALRVSATGPGIAPDSANEWSHAWIDTAFAKHYASKAGLALDFWMRGTRGDTLAKFRSKAYPVVIWFDTLGSAWFAGRVTSRADSTDTLSVSRFKLIGQYNYVPWCTSINTWGAQGFITGWYKDTIGMVGNPPLHGSYIGVSLRQKYYKNNSLAKEVWSIRGGGYKSHNDSTREAWRFPLAIVDPGDLGLNTDAFSRNGSQRIRFATPFYWFKVDTVCVPDSVAWVDTTGQIHTPGIDLLPRVVAPLDSHKIWASEESLWFNDKVGVFHPIYPSAGGGALVFGDTNAYYASVASFGTGRDSVGGYYFSGPGAIQKAINAASAAATITNKKTVYIMEGVYAQNCSLKSNVNLVGSGMEVTVVKTGRGGNPIFTARGASNFTVRDLSLVCDSATVANLYDSLATAGCKNVLYYNFAMYSSPLLGSNSIIALIKTQAADSVKLINCNFGLGGQDQEYGYSCWGALRVTMDGGLVFMDKVTLNSGPNFPGALFTKTDGILDVSNSSFCSNTGSAVDLAENKQQGKDFFINCSFYSEPGQSSFFNSGTGYLAAINVHGCTFYEKYTPSIGVQQNNYVSGKMFNCNTNPMLQAGWGPSANWMVNIEWQSNATGERGGFHYGSVDFDTVNGLSAAPHAGYNQFKANASPNDTDYIYMDGGWRNIDRTWATGRDSVLVNQASDTLAITGIQTTSFVEVQLESDPGVNIGSPYHTLTANQDILIWPVACVNKFYYRWRIH